MDKVNQKMRKFNLRGVLTGLRSSVTASQKQDTPMEEGLKSENFQISKIICHGFPYQPTCLASDPLQNLLAIGNRSGYIKILGKPGVEWNLRHQGGRPITQLLFIINEGSLISVTSNDEIHMWTLKKKKPELVHSLKFQREKISICHLPFLSKWLYVGTDRGNVQIVNLESFALSGYIINWNKAMELIRLVHPGSVVHLSDNPVDPSKLLIGFETGSVVLWDLKLKAAELRFSCSENLRSVCWHQDGKQFICSHGDGSLTVWNVKQTQKPQSYMMPHAKLGKDGKPEHCRPIYKVDYRSARNSEPFIIFNGGTIQTTQTPSLTVMHGSNMTVLEMEHQVVQFIVLCSTPWNYDFQDPHAIVVLLKNDLVFVDLNSTGYPCFENPYPMDIHESPVTTCSYYADCPLDLIPAFYSVGCKRNRTGYSEREWPISGGEGNSFNFNYSEIILTGHADGSVKFWDASGTTLHMLYKLKTAKVFDASKSKRSDDDDDEDCMFAVQLIRMCLESRLLCVAGYTHVLLFKFSKLDTAIEYPVLEISIVYEVCDGATTPDMEYPVMFPSRNNPLTHQSGSVGSYSANGKESVTSVKVRPGVRKWPAGYQPELCCLLTWIEKDPPPPISSLSLNSKFGLLAFGDECGIAVVDIVQKTCLLSMGTPDLYGSLDPYSRAPRSPKLKSIQSAKLSTLEHLSQTTMSDDCRSPTTDQFSYSCETKKSAINPDGIKPILKKSTLKSKTPQSKFLDRAPAFKTYSCPYLNPNDDPLTSAPDKKIIFTLNDLQSHQKNSQENLDKAENILESSKAISEGFNVEDALGIKSSSWKNDRGGVMMEGEVTRVPEQRRSSMPPSPTEQNHYSTQGSLDDNKNLDEAINSNDTKTFNDSKNNNDTKSCIEYANKSDNKSKNESNKTAQSIEAKFEDADASTEDEDIDSYFNEYASSHSNVLLNALSNDRFSNSSKNSLTSIPEVDGGVTRGRNASNARGKDLNSVSGSSRTPLAPGVKELKGLRMSRSTSMLRRLAQKRNEFVQNKSVSEDLSVEEPTYQHHALKGIASADVYNSNPLKVSEHHEHHEHHGGLLRRHTTMKKFWGSIFKGGGHGSPKNKRKSFVDVIDLSDDLPNSHHIKRYSFSSSSNKGDNTFCRSHSSSTTSLENVNKESIVQLSFNDVYCRKSDTTTSPCLWLGTSLGTVLVISISLPVDADQRRREPVIISPSGTIFRLRGSITTINFLDCTASLVLPASEPWKETREKSSSFRQSPALKNRISPTSSIELNVDKQYAVICSEKQARVISLPSQTCSYKVKVTETSCVAVAEVIPFKDSACLTCYVANGHIAVFSLPSLKPLIDVDYVTNPDVRVAKTICFSSFGACTFMPSPTELLKITLSAETSEGIKEGAGDLFFPSIIPEAPKMSFFKNLFGGSTAVVDREELFGESSGKASKGMAKYTAGPAGINMEANNACSEIGRAKMAALERGEKLGDLEERTERMKMEAEQFSMNAHQLKMKYKDKKWYQF